MTLSKLITPALWLLMACGTVPTANPNKVSWSIPITPPMGGPTFNIGAWKNNAQCADMDGSFMYAHPFQCHFTGLPKDCGIIGNGQAYSKDVPYPAPMQIAGNCVQVETGMTGWHFLEYHSLPTAGGSAPLCAEFPHYKGLADADPLHFQVATVSKGCGGPCWPARVDNACE